MIVTSNRQGQRVNVTILIVLSFLFVFRWLTMPSHQHLHHQLPPPRGKTVNMSRIISISTSLPCDEECLRFGRLMETWPADKPKAAVVLLLRTHSRFGRSSKLFSANFNNAYNYPVIVFHEGDMNNEAKRKQLRSSSNSDLYLQVGRLSPVE